MAASTKPTSPWVSSYSDKTDDWLRARLEYLGEKELISLCGSTLRRKEIRDLRVALLGRKKAAAEALAWSPVPIETTASSVPVAAQVQFVPR